MDIVMYATILLTLRLISMAFIGFVFWRQYKLFRIKVVKYIQRHRILLFAMSICIIGMNFVPAIIDVMTIMGSLTRTAAVVNPVSLIYAFTWAFSTMLVCITLWLLYMLADITDSKMHESDHINMTNEEVK